MGEGHILGLIFIGAFVLILGGGSILYYLIKGVCKDIAVSNDGAITACYYVLVFFTSGLGVVIMYLLRRKKTNIQYRLLTNKPKNSILHTIFFWILLIWVSLGNILVLIGKDNIATMLGYR